jgi:hypothetical protein
MIVNTQISYGYKDLIDVFFKANELNVDIEDMTAYPYGKVILHYEDDSETACSITFMSIKHLGFENMLCDYLIKCGISPSLIPIGKLAIKRDMNELDKEWENHKKSIMPAR